MSITVKNLKYSYPDGQEVLSISDFGVKKGERIFLSGPSGSGKTTLLGLITGILALTSGSLKVLETEMKDLSSKQRDAFRALHIGYVFQLFNLLPFLSLVDNVTLPLKLCPQRKKRLRSPAENEAERLLRELGIPEALFSRKASQLSVGQQQRVAVARALIGSPTLVVCDEPTAALDEQSKADFLKVLFDQCERSGASLLFVSHELSLAGQFQRHVRMGEMNHSGKP